MTTSNNNLVKYTMTIGLYLGIICSASVFLFHVMSRIHIPGDSIGVVNTAIMAFLMLFYGRKYRDTMHQGVFIYRQAYKFCLLLVLFSGFIYAFFSYIYYAIIQPQGISYYIDQIKLIYSQQPGLTPEQVDTLITLYKSTITPGMMAFVVFLSHVFMGALVSLLAAVFIKSPVQFTQENN
ncbi:MAG: hypothetical protein CVU09_02945 [Bacteroidetes bacterium HGW-Bacteroidetes-4]|jgi:hypothetical protein|nr:MAG: hypothetical protein CVU09_02945 [Bacteroidetes bacterium HGW-Bacteroidetes-4]